MQKLFLYITTGLLIAVTLSVYSCKKVNGVDNDQVIETPYSLYFTDIAGVLYNSNDGKTSNKLPFLADGYPCRALCISYNNLFLCKDNLYISGNNGQNFNHSFDSLGKFPDTSCSGYPFDLNQSMIINISAWNNLFCITTEPSSYDNYLGVRFNISGGDQGSWWSDLPDSLNNIGGYGGADTIHMTSLTLLTNDVLCGYDAHSNRNFYRTKNTLWNECTANPDSNVAGSVTLQIGNPYNKSGVPLPHRRLYPPSGPPDLTANYSYGHINKQLIAIDQKDCNGVNGAYYSNDTGRNWTQFSGLPDKPLLCVGAPFEQICLIGTDGAGLYILNTNTNIWQANNKGLASNLIVRSIAAKQNIYKNGKTLNYIYIATNQGIYQSTDGGNNWTLTFQGNFTAIY